MKEMDKMSKVLKEYLDSYQQMIDDMGGKESAGWYGWIDLDLVKRMGVRLAELEAPAVYGETAPHNPKG